MRVAFHNASVHEGSWVALVAVADNVLLRGVLALYLRPFSAGREAAAAASAQSGVAHFLDDLVRSHVEQSFFKRRISAL